jgi:hypothetical protein
MLLQTDPTVIYGMGAAYDGNIRKADLERDTPWNTYRRAGPAADADRDAGQGGAAGGGASGRRALRCTSSPAAAAGTCSTTASRRTTPRCANTS